MPTYATLQKGIRYFVFIKISLTSGGGEYELVANEKRTKEGDEEERGKTMGHIQKLQRRRTPFISSHAVTKMKKSKAAMKKSSGDETSM